MRLSAALRKRSLGGKVLLCNSGAEANEAAAIELARRARPGGNVVVLEGAFHGRTYGALSATPQESKQAPFAPLVPGLRGRARRTPSALVGRGRPSDTAAVLLEPIQGETGIHVLSDDLLRRRARGVRPQRRGADLRRDPDAGWGGRARCGPTSRPASFPTRSRARRRSVAGCRSAR